MKNYYRNAWVVFAGLLALLNCSKKPTDYRSFLGGQEITYPGIISNPGVYPGNGRLLLTWHPSPDPSVTKYVVYWNNNSDSVVVSAVSHQPSDTVKCLINGLSEYAYTFFVYSYDNAGNKSVMTEIDNARVYGPIYQSGLHNRPYNATNPFVVNPDGSATLNFLAPYDTVNITTFIKYTNTSGVLITTQLSPDSSSITLPAYKGLTPVAYQSSFVPKRGAIDTFYTSKYDTFPQIFSYVMCDKSLFSAMNLPYDMQPYESDTKIDRLWDGNMQPRDYPNIFHSDGNLPLPAHFSFDMGKVYADLGKIEETGRVCCHNPGDLEVWGIADTTGAISTLAGNNPGWKADVQAKGWTLLTEVIRTDNGAAPVDANFILNPPPVRFIMIRVIQTVDNSNYVNMSQLTFWNKQ